MCALSCKRSKRSKTQTFTDAIWIDRLSRTRWTRTRMRTSSWWTLYPSKSWSSWPDWTKKAARRRKVGVAASAVSSGRPSPRATHALSRWRQQLPSSDKSLKLASLARLMRLRRDLQQVQLLGTICKTFCFNRPNLKANTKPGFLGEFACSPLKGSRLLEFGFENSWDIPANFLGFSINRLALKKSGIRLKRLLSCWRRRYTCLSVLPIKN